MLNTKPEGGTWIDSSLTSLTHHTFSTNDSVHMRDLDVSCDGKLVAALGATETFAMVWETENPKEMSTYGVCCTWEPHANQAITSFHFLPSASSSDQVGIVRV